MISGVIKKIREDALGQSYLSKSPDECDSIQTVFVQFTLMNHVRVKFIYFVCFFFYLLWDSMGQSDVIIRYHIQFNQLGSTF